MRIININFATPPKRHIIAKEGENLAATLSINVSSVESQWPRSEYAIIIKRADKAVYPAASGLIASNDGLIEYTLTRQDTDIHGSLLVEVQARQADTLVKSQTFSFTISEGLTSGKTPGPSAPDWIGDVLSAPDEAAAARDDAVAARDEAIVARDEAVAAAETGTGTGDHQKLTNRDARDAHPIDAVSGLSASLSVLEESMPEPMTNEEIQNLFN